MRLAPFLHLTARCLVLAAATAAAANAQDGSSPRSRLDDAEWALVGEVKEQLRSDNPKTVAWGAHIAAERRVVACGVDLQLALRRVATLDSAEWVRAKNALLDAAMQTGAQLTNDDLSPYLGSELGAILVLARPARRATPLWDKTLLATFRSHGAGSDAWRACGNLLARQAHPGFVLDLLRTPTTVSIVATSQNEQAFQSHSSACSAPVGRLLGWPPRTEYQLLFVASAGAQVLVAGPLPVFVVRHTEGVWPLIGDREPAHLTRSTWLAHLLGADATVSLGETERWINIRWTNNEQFLADVAKERATVEREWRAVVAECVRRNLIGAAAAQELQPPITIAVEDERSDTRVPLPDVR